MAHIERANAEALIPEEVSRNIIQETVKGSIALSLGMRMPDMIRKQLKMPVMTGTVSADFVNGDTGLKNTSQMTWDKVINKQKKP